MTKDNSIIIDFNQFQEGIGSTSVLGNQNLRNCDIWTDEGVLQADFQLNNEKDNELALTFTADAGTDLISAASTLQRDFNSVLATSVGRAVTFTSTGTLPAGLVAGTVYFLSTATGNGTTQARLASTLALAEAATPDIDITDAGSGTHTVTTVNMGLVKHYVDSAGIFSNVSIVALDENGRVWIRGTYWQLLDGNTLTASGGKGLALWKDYLFVFRFTDIDIYGDVNGTPTWTNSWYTSVVGGGSIFVPEGNAEHKTLVMTNDILYFANKPTSVSQYNTIGSLHEETTFDPTNAATYTLNPSALDLPDYIGINDLEEFNGKLHVASDKLYIYPWDTISDSFDEPIQSPEQNISALKTFNNILFFSAGARGNMYKTLGTTVMTALEFSDDVSGIPENTIEIYDIEIYQGFLILSINIVKGVALATGPFTGVYMFNPDTGVYFLKNRSTQGYGTFATAVTLSRLFSNSTSNISYYVSAKSGTIYTLETTSGIYAPQRQQTYTSFLSQKLQVGTFQEPRTFQKIELFLKEALGVDESVVVSFSGDSKDGTLTPTNTFNFTSMEGKMMESQTLNLQSVYEIQFSITINPGPTSGVTALYNTPKVRYIKLT